MTTPLETLTLCAGAGDFPIESITATNFVLGVGVAAAEGVGALVTGTGVDVVVEGGIVVVVRMT